MSKSPIVTISILGKKFTFPLGARVKVPKEVEGYKSKLDLAQDILKYLIKYYPEIKSLPIAFDSWYGAKKFLKWLSENGFRWVCPVRQGRIFLSEDKGQRFRTQDLLQGIKCHQWRKNDNLNIRYRNLGNFNIPGYGLAKVVALWDIKRSPRKVILITNQLKEDGIEIIRQYCQRWKIECSYRELKNDFGFEDFHMRHFTGISAYLSLLLVSYQLTTWMRWRCKLEGSLGEITQQGYHEYIKLVMSNKLDSFISGGFKSYDIEKLAA